MKKEMTTEEHLQKFHEQLDNIFLFVAIGVGISVFSFIIAIVTLMRA